MHKVGIMGGTFDPIHVGHLILAESAYQQFGLDEVLIMPSGNPPHKKDRTGGPTLDQRIEMVSLAIEDNDHFTLSTEEAHDKGYTYTRATLERLTSENPDTEYYFIMGADSLFYFDTWKDPERIAQLAVLVVATRYHVDEVQLSEAIASVGQKFGATIEKLSTPNMDISSSMIRDWVRQKQSIRYYVPDRVIDYITKAGIYVNCQY